MNNKLMNTIKSTIVKRKAKKGNCPILKVSDRATIKFRETVKNNKKKTDYEIRLKLSRNFYAGETIYDNNNIKIVAYGYLYIKYNSVTNEIYNICNYTTYSKVKNGYINYSIKNKLNILYRIGGNR